jgi:hypothetical protein
MGPNAAQTTTVNAAAAKQIGCASAKRSSSARKALACARLRFWSSPAQFGYSADAYLAFEFIVVAQLALELEGRFPCPACPIFQGRRQLQTMPSTRCLWRQSGRSIAFGWRYWARRWFRLPARTLCLALAQWHTRSRRPARGAKAVKALKVI